MQLQSMCALAGAEGFREIFDAMISPEEMEEVEERHHSGRGRPAKISSREVLMGAVWQGLNAGGTAAEQTEEVSGCQMAESSLSERKQGFDREMMDEVLGIALRPVESWRHSEDGVYGGMELYGVDGTSFSLVNTSSIRARLSKARSRRGREAFARMGVCCICQLGVHNPVAAAIGWEQEAEMPLARKVFAKLPRGALLLGDRYYGNRSCISELMPLCRQRGSHLLFRVREDLKVERISLCEDGSWQVRITVEGKSLLLREICGQILDRNNRLVTVRLLTTLRNSRKYPAVQLLELYGRRWEQELAYNELKQQLHDGRVLRSQTVETAALEIAALLMAQTIVANFRVRMADRLGVKPLRLSFSKLHRKMLFLLTMIEAGRGIFREDQVRAVIRKTQRRLLAALLPRRRERSCPREVRQPVSGWPRLRKRRQSTGELHFDVNPVL